MIKIILQAFDDSLVDASASSIKNAAARIGVKIKGPIPLPSKIKKYIVLTSPHVDKDAREKFERKRYTRLFLVEGGKILEALHDSIVLPAGVHVKIKSYAE